MAKMVITKSLLTNIANAIREKTGKTAEITPAEMATEIENIETGGGDDQSAGIVERTVTSYKNGAAKKVGYYAFYYCSSLTSIDLPAATSIGNFAFSSCSELTSVDLPAATSIGYYAFSGCSKLTSVDLPAATSIGSNAFQKCTSLTSIDLPAATSMGRYAFQDCTSLTSVDLPAATNIGGNAFSGCYKLTSIDLPAATSIEDYAFYGCTSLTSVDLPAATSIERCAFMNTGVEKISAPNVETIQNEIYGDFKTLTFPKLTKIYYWAFAGSKNLKYFDFLGSPTQKIPYTPSSSYSKYVFNSNVLAEFVIRCETGVVPIDTSFDEILNKKGPIYEKTGYIYVPSALVESYKTATNWSTYAAQFRALEDYTVDGTTTGVLDPTKTGVTN